jgi:Recombination endonuclease VII
MSRTRLDLSSGVRTCIRCEVEKPLSEFYVTTNPTKTPFSCCKDCTRERQRDYEESPTGRINRRRRAYRHNLKKMYGLTLEAYEKLLAEQEGLCAICRQPESARGRGGEVKPLAVDHDHGTGAVRGLLCHLCNVVIGNALDDPDRLEAAARYLRRSMCRK